MKHYKNSLEYLNQSLEIAMEIGVKLEISQIYREMSLAYAAEHQIDSAEKYLDLYMIMQDSLRVNDEALNSFTHSLEVNASHNIGIHERENQTLGVGHANEEMLAIISGWITILILVVGLIVFIFIILAYNMALRRKLKSRN